MGAKIYAWSQIGNTFCMYFAHQFTWLNLPHSWLGLNERSFFLYMWLNGRPKKLLWKQHEPRLFACLLTRSQDLAKTGKWVVYTCGFGCFWPIIVKKLVQNEKPLRKLNDQIKKHP